MDSLNLNARVPYATDEELHFITLKALELRRSDEMVMIGAGPGVMLLAAREGGLDFDITVIDNLTTRYAEAHLNGAGLNVRVYYVIGDSKFIGKLWSGRPVKFLIIDGDHSYEGVQGDLRYWLPHIAPHGTIFIHDYDADGTRFENMERYPGTRQAVAESELMDLTKWFRVGRVGTAIVFEKQ